MDWEAGRQEAMQQEDRHSGRQADGLGGGQAGSYAAGRWS
jgi:hypothetical protein